MKKELEAKGRQVLDPETPMYDERKAEQRRGDDETSPEGRLQMMEDISQAEENKEEEETSGEIETSSGLPMPHTKKEGSRTLTNTTRSTKQLGDMARLTT